MKQTRSDNDGRISIYAPKTESARQTSFSSVDEFISKGDDNVIGEDLNCIANVRLDKIGGS